jgi:hypothetical protein
MVQVKKQFVVMKENDIGLVNKCLVHARNRPEDFSHSFVELPLPPSPLDESSGFPIPMEDPNYPKALGDPDFPQVIFHTTLGNITFEVLQLFFNQIKPSILKIRLVLKSK